MFTIDIEDRSISCQPERIVGGLNFDSQEGLLSLAADRGWGKEDMTAIWNSFAGTPEFNDCREQKCFKNRNYAVERIWAAIQRLSQPVTAHGNGHKPIVVSASDSVAPRIPAVLAVAMATEPAETAPAGAQAASAATEGPEAGETTSQPEEAPLSTEPVGDGKQIEDMIVVPRRKRNKKMKELKVKIPKQPKAKATNPATERKRAAAGKGKKDQAIAMFMRKDGATGADVCERLGWNKSSVAMTIQWVQLVLRSGIKSLDSAKNSKGERVYRGA